MAFVGPSDLVWLAHHGNGFAESIVAAYLGCPRLRPDLCSHRAEVAASPLSYVHAGVPPAYFEYGDRDETVPVASQGLPIARRWAAARGDHSGVAPFTDGVHLEVAHADHNLNLTNVDPRAMEAWLHSLLAHDFVDGSTAPSAPR